MNSLRRIDSQGFENAVGANVRIREFSKGAEPRVWGRSSGLRRNEFEGGGRAHVRHKAPENCLCRALHFFGSKVQLVVSVSVMDSTVCPLPCLLLFYSRCPRSQPFVKVGARPPAPYGVRATGQKCPFPVLLVC